MPFNKIQKYALEGKLGELKREITTELANGSSLQSLIESGTEEGGTPLLLAAGEGHANVVEYLLTQKANLRVKSKGDFTSLDKAINGAVRLVESGKDAKNFYAIIRMLLQRDIGLLGIADSSGITPFDTANREKYPEIKKTFLQIVKEIDSCHPLLMDEELVRQIQQEIVEAKLVGLDFSIRDFPVTRLSPVQQRVLLKIGEQYFKFRGKPPSPYRRGKLYFLFSKDEQKVIDYAINWNPHFAAANGHVEIMQILLNNGLDPNLMDDQYGATLLTQASFSSHTKMVQLLLDNGALALKANRNGETPLQFLQRNLEGREKIVELLKSAEIKEGEIMRSRTEETSQRARYSHSLSEEEGEEKQSSGLLSFFGGFFRRHNSDPARYQALPKSDDAGSSSEALKKTV